MTTTRAVLITGPLASGKTTVSICAGDVLDSANVANAVIDLDWLCWAGPSLSRGHLSDLMCANLAAVRQRYSQAGIHTLVLCRAVMSHSEINDIRTAVGGHLVAFRLSVPVDVLTERLHARGNRADLVEAAAIDAAQASQQVRHIPAVKNHGRDAEHTAIEVLTRIGWLSAPALD